MSLLKDRSTKAIEQLKEQLYQDVYNRVAKKLVEETNARQEEINKQLTERLENWDIMLDEHVKKKVEEEWKLRNGQSDN